MLNFSADYLRRVGQAIFEAAGAPAEIASEVARSLVDANLAGHDSHGVLRIPAYLAMIKPGQLDPAARPTVLQETPTSLLIDGRWAFGQISGLFAADRVIEKALDQGIAIAGIVRCCHMGRMGEYAERAVARGAVLMATVGGFGNPAAVPYGGAKRVYGTNPITYGFGGAETEPVIIDLATTTVAEGKLRFARAKNEPLAPGLILDRDGNPSTNPEDFYDGGALLPFGGHKGSALALLSDLLGQALTGSARHAGENAYPALGPTGTTMIAINGGIFQPPSDYAADVDRIVQRVKAIPPAPGFDEVLVAGDPERRHRAARLANGVPLPEATWEALQAAAAEWGVRLPEA